MWYTSNVDNDWGRCWLLHHPWHGLTHHWLAHHHWGSHHGGSHHRSGCHHHGSRSHHRCSHHGLSHHRCLRWHHVHLGGTCLDLLMLCLLGLLLLPDNNDDNEYNDKDNSAADPAADGPTSRLRAHELPIVVVLPEDRAVLLSRIGVAVTCVKVGGK